MFYSFVQKICAAFFAKFGIHMAVFSGGIVGRCFPLCTLTILYQQRGSHRRLGNAHGARDDLVEASCVSFASVQARKLNHSVSFSFPHEVVYFVGTPFMAGHCVSKQVGRHDAACQGCPRCVSRSPKARCLRVFARAVRFSQPAVLSALLVIQLFGGVFPPPNSSRKHRKERCGHFRSQRSFITFYGALRNILLSAGFPVTIHMIALEQTFVNNAPDQLFPR